MSRDKIKEIYSFKCPRWNELPEEPLFNQEAVEYINSVLEPLMVDEKAITTTMVQNYVKHGYLPKSYGRKYDRTQIAYLIVISIYKQVLNIKEVRKGLDLQLSLMDYEKAYNTFARSLNKALRRTFKPLVLTGEFHLDEFKSSKKSAGVDMIANSFSLKLLGTILIQNDGFQGLGGENEQDRNNS